LLGGLLAGSFIIFVLRERLRRRSFGRKLLLQSLIFLGFIAVLICLVSAINAWSIQAEDFWQTFSDAVFNLRVLRLFFTWFVIVIATLFMLDVSEKYGSGVLPRMLTGKYHHPRMEERIFMFLDLTDSTGLAERLGDEKYFQLLRTLFYMSTEPVLNCEGEIYQYVGDEIIISWTIESGMNNANCLQCFFRIGKTIEKNRNAFLKQFGVAPVFKAAVHTGNVVIGEIGVIKKDIVYAGDVLNSTARMLSLSKDLHAPLLVSDAIYERLKEAKDYTYTFLDAIVLRGKTTETRIYGVQQR
jgi:adenylate cyclase